MNEPVTITTEYQTYRDVTLPTKVKVPRKHLDDQRIKIESESYVYKDILLDKSFNPWGIGNVLLGGVIGLGVDFLTGSIYQPDRSVYNLDGIIQPKAQTTEKKGE